MAAYDRLRIALATTTRSFGSSQSSNLGSAWLGDGTAMDDEIEGLLKRIADTKTPRRISGVAVRSSRTNGLVDRSLCGGGFNQNRTYAQQ